ncbi:hypothetical protein Glove_229g84 [Diversispora epigaea]|uniref:BACK domain-containing protein n=1 Tax=Diversispora epigaea TaxID=1348612 RepID=A0A397IM18_9GLOM|nr:hypothetical protein Glove_229g84 [Diversispora epigaea]
MIVANELEFEELSEKLGSYFIESRVSWLKTHFSHIYHSIFNSNLTNSTESAQKEIAENSNKRQLDLDEPSTDYLHEFKDFTLLQEAALISVLENNNLQLEEIKIWDYVVKWGIAQNPNLPKDFEEWSKENFKALKTTLQQCLPLIRYFHISEKDIWEN